MTKNDEWRELAYHEAGHAVCALAEGRAFNLRQSHIKELYLIRPEKRYKETRELGPGMTGEVIEGGALLRSGMGKLLDIKCDCRTCRDDLSSKDRALLDRVIEWHAIVSFGGPAATGIVKGYTDNMEAFHDGGHGDMVEGVKALSRLYSAHGFDKRKVDIEEVFQQAYERTVTFLRGQWKCVEAIGEAAMQAERLGGHVIEAIAKPLWRADVVHEPFTFIQERGWRAA